MSKQSGRIKEFWKTANTASHPFRPTTEIFASIDEKVLERQLNVKKQAEERAKQDRPASSDASLDGVELEIVQAVTGLRDTSFNNLDDQIETFSMRLSNLDFQSQFSQIEKHHGTATTDFQAEAQKGRNILHDLREKLHDASKGLKTFRAKYRVDHVPQLTSGGKFFFKIAILLLIFLIETISNGYFLAKGNQFGLVGGFMQAILFSVLNIGVALLLSILWVRRIYLPGFFNKLFACLGIVTYIGFLIGFNIALANYREVSAETFGDAGRLVISRIKSNPFALEDIESWMLFGIGMLFSIIAFIDGWFITDPFPGYAKAYRNMLIARENYTNEQADCIDTLTETRDEHNEYIQSVIDKMRKDRSEYGDILANRAKHLSLFAAHQDMAERTINALLKTYREANRKARNSPVPDYFESSYQLERRQPTLNTAPELSSEEITATIHKAQEQLSVQINDLTRLCAEAIDSYHELDNLYPDEVSRG